MKTLPDVLSRLRALIAHSSVSSNDPRFDSSNLAVIHLLAELLEILGFSVTIHAISPSKANLLASLGGGGAAGEGLVLSGHTDTVPFDEGAWSFDPFKGIEQQGRLYGLGSCDMKAFFALAIEAVQGFDAKSFRRPLTILATADEESSMSGAKYLVKHGIKPGRYAIIGEPTGLKPIRMHKGVMMESIIVHGHSGHASDPSLGASAIEGMNLVIAELLAWRRELQQKHQNPAFKVAVPTVNLGVIHGGDNPNRICGRCEMQIDIRAMPGMDLDELRHSMAHRLAGVLADYPLLRLEEFPLFGGVPPFATPADSVMVRACEEFSGSESGTVSFGTEAPFLTELGVETVVLGAGNIERAHQPDEFLPLVHINPMVDILKGLIGRFCVEESRQA